MSEHDEPKGALDEDNPDEEGAGDQGLASETGAVGGPGGTEQDVTDLMPEARGPVKYGDEDDPEGEPRTPQEGRVEEGADDARDASSGAKD